MSLSIKNILDYLMNNWNFGISESFVVDSLSRYDCFISIIRTVLYQNEIETKSIEITH